MAESWFEATKDQYNDDANLAARQAAFHYLVEADPLPPPISDFSTVSGQVVLDVGCGNGLFLNGANAAATVAIGTDLSPGMLAAAAVAVPGAPLFQATATALPVADHSIDVTMALWVLYHVADKQAAVRELRRVTKPSGYAVVSTNTGESSFLDELVGDALETVLGRPVDAWIARLGFNGENGEEILRTGFERIETHRANNRFEFTDTEVVVRYVGSMLDAIVAENGELDHQALLAEVGRRAAARIDEAGHVELSQQRAVFICRSADGAVQAAGPKSS